jgi:hypothetical protein
MFRRLVNSVMLYMSHRMIACDEASFLVSFREDHPLGFKGWWQLKMHLFTCHLCRKYARQMRQLNHSMEDYRDHCSDESCMHHLSSEAGARIGEKVTRELNAK